MKKQIKKHKHLVNYIIQLDEFRKEHLSFIVAETYFKQGEFAWAIKEIKDAIGISKDINIKVISDPRIKSAAHIEIPVNLFKKRRAKSYTYVIRIQSSKMNDFNTFLVCIAHELSHLLLFINGNTLWENEQATDTLAMIAGFGTYFHKQRNFSDLFSMYKKTYGYLSDDEMNFVYLCFRENKKFRIKEKKPWYKKIF